MRLFNIERLFRACRYSLDGLKAAFRRETACQQEAILLLAAVPTTFLMGVTMVERILLIASLLFVLVVELLNTAVETLVNMVSPEYHPLAKYAKDLGSAAVFVSLILGGLVWCGILGQKLGLFQGAFGS